MSLRVATALAALAVLPASASASSAFQWGVIAGDVTSSSAILWTKADHAGKFSVRWGATRGMKDGKATVRASKAHDDTMRATAHGLKADRTYYFQFTDGDSVTPVGTFHTAPKPTADKTIRFGWSGDMDGTAAPGKSKPYWNNFGVLSRMAAAHNAFNIMLGDTIYSDTEVPGKEGKERALTVKDKWAKYVLVRDQANEQKFTKAGGTYWQWDDHEFINDFSPNDNVFDGSGGGTQVGINGHALYKLGKQAFMDYTPVGYSSKTGDYRAVRWGKNLEIFILDERTFRSGEAKAACKNPQTGQPDLAPTAPQKTRNLFSLVVPSLSQPVSQQCLDTINSPQRTFLGSAQWAKFTSDLKSSTATWKAVMTEMEAKQYYANPYDRWEGYESDRQRLLNLVKSVKNTVLLATDVHANLGVDARFKTLEDGGPVNSGVFELSTGPVATKNFNQEISDTVGSSSGGDLIVSAFLKPQPPDGIGMDCAATKSFSYGEVTASATKLELAPIDIDGNPVKQDDGTPCGPFSFTAK